MITRPKKWLSRFIFEMCKEAGPLQKTLPLRGGCD